MKNHKLKIVAILAVMLAAVFTCTACISINWSDIKFWEKKIETPADDDDEPGDGGETPRDTGGGDDEEPGDEEPVVPTLADATWAQIAQVSASGKASEYWAVGDTKDIELSTTEVITLEIWGFDHDDLSDGSGKAGITFGMAAMLQETVMMNNTATNSGGWANCFIRTGKIPGIFGDLPEDLQDVIKTVNKKTSSGGSSSSIVTVSDKLFLFSQVEINATTVAVLSSEGEQYEYWRTVKDGGGVAVNTDRIKKIWTGTVWAAGTWWLRSSVSTVSQDFQRVTSAGNINSNMSNSLHGICFGFCV